MNILEKFSKNHTLIFCIILAVVFVIIFGFGLVLLLIIPSLPKFFYYFPAYDYILNSLNNIIAFIVLICIAHWIGLSKYVPWNIKGVSKGILLGFTFIIFSFIQLFLMYNNTFDKTVAINWLGVILGIIYCISIALWEEILCRGIILTSILRKWYGKEKGIFKAIVVSSLIFGCAHLITAFNGNLITSLIQVCYASVMGMLIGVIYIKTRSLYSAISLHIILNIPAYILPYIMPFLGGMYDYEFIGLIVLFSFIWILFTYLISQRITEDDIDQFIQ